MSGIIDSHAHVQSREYDEDRDAVLQRAWDAGLSAIVVVGDDEASSDAAVALASTDGRLFATVGYHPHVASQVGPEEVRRLARLARSSPRVVAIGEIGLDFYRNISPPAAQRAAFRAQLDLADELSLPVVIHSRDADEETFDILSRWAAGSRPRPLGVMHCFSGDLDLARRYVDLGFLISISGTVTYPKNQRLQEVAARVPLDAMVVETDSPYLTPQVRRGRRNEPALITHTVDMVAGLRGQPFEEIAHVTRENTARLFRLHERSEAVVGGKGAL